jgi:hypothetical protein
MATNIERYKSDLEKLLKVGSDMELDLSRPRLEAEGKLTKEMNAVFEQVRARFDANYQSWYTESLALIRQLVPERLTEFEQLYKGEGKRRVIDANTYNIQDWLNGVRAATRLGWSEKAFNDYAIVSMRFHTQLAILGAVKQRFHSSLFDIKQLLQADLFDSEI